MMIMKNYADLCRMISIIETQIEMLQNDVDFWFGKGDVPFESRGAKFGIGIAAENTDRVLKRIHELERQLEFYTELKSEMDEHINSLTGLEYKVAYMRFVEDKTYKEIADELGYSYGYVRNLAARSRQEEQQISDDNDVTHEPKKP